MTQVDCLCVLIFLAFICGGNGGFEGVSGDGCCGMCGGGGGGGGGVVGGARAGSIGCNQCFALDWCINCFFLSSICLLVGILVMVVWWQSVVVFVLVEVFLVEQYQNSNSMNIVMCNMQTYVCF